MLLQFSRTARAPAMPQRFLSSTTFRQSCYPLIPRLPSMEWLLMPVLATVPARQAWGSSCRRLWLCTCVMCLAANLRHDCRWPWQAWVLVVYWRDRAVALQLVLPCMGSAQGQRYGGTIKPTSPEAGSFPHIVRLFSACIVDESTVCFGRCDCID